MRIILKLATEEDYDVFYKMKSDPVGIRWGGWIEKPDYNKFKTWFFINRHTIKRRIFLAYAGNIAVGYLYFDKINFNVFEISIAILSEYSGKGIGTAIIKEAIALIKQEVVKDFEICAYISSENRGSMKILKEMAL